MSFLALLPLLQDAPTGTPAGGGSPFGGMLVPMVLVVVIFYVVMIGPERKNKKRRQEMLNSLSKGDKVMTNGGLYGAVTQVQEQVVTLQVADGVRMRFALTAIQQKLEDTEEKN